MKSRIIRVTAANNLIRGFFANTTGMVEKAMTLHQASPVAIAALGRTLTATSMMGLMMKGEDQRLTVKINGGGPLGTIMAVGNSKGIVKGYVDNPQVESTLIRPGKLNVGAAVGTEGEIMVIRDMGPGTMPYVGTYPLTTGEIAEDITAYFFHSEQQPSAVALGVLVDVDYHIKASGGFIVQVMPDIDEATLTKLEQIIATLPPITQMMEQGLDEQGILMEVLGSLDPVVLATYEVDFECDCHEERLERALISIGRKDLQEIIEEDGGAEMVCHFCNKKYYFDKEKLEELLKEAK